MRDYLDRCHSPAADRCHSLAVLGGTFDPIHLGHLAVAEAVLEHFGPMRVLFIPCGVPPHKANVHTPAEHRYAMALLATCEHPDYDVSHMEIDRQGPSYTIDTARQLMETCPEGTQIYFIVGADALAQLPNWKEADALIRLVRFIAVPRPGFPGKEMKKQITALNERYGERFFKLKMRKTDISGTGIRRAMAEGKNVSSKLPPSVEEYATTHGLYRKPLSYETVRATLQKRLSPQRYVHTLGVIKEADKLARHYGADPEKARWAALLHDCAKGYSTDKKRALCKKWGIKVLRQGKSPSVTESAVNLTHGPLGAETAARDFAIQDKEILQAIRYHSTGHGAMTLLDKVIMLADFIEPYRDDYPPLAHMRALAYTDMDKALQIGIEYTLEEEAEAGNPIHPASYEALEMLTGRAAPLL